jgi:hypothetical protein
MDELTRYPTGPNAGSMSPSSSSQGSLLDVLDRVLDKGVVIAGDIKINLLDIELLTIKIRLLIASADKAREMGIDWWSHDPQLSSKAQDEKGRLESDKQNKALRERVERLESQLKALTHNGDEHGEQRAPHAAQAARGRRG